MMNKECLLIIKEIAANIEDGDLCLKILTNIINYEGDYQDMRFEAIDPSKTEEVSPLLDRLQPPASTFTDYRLKSLEFSYFRSFPADAQTGTNFGLQFQKDGIPCSTFLVGRNSTGKSTIFDAIEYYYAHRLGNAEQKSIEEKDYHQYLTYGFGKIEEAKKITTGDVSLIVQTQACKRVGYQLDKLSRICAPAMFCSENDIIEIGHKEKELESFFFKQLDYTVLKSISLSLEIIIKGLAYQGSEQEQEQAFLEPQEVEEVIQVFMDYYYHGRERALKLCENKGVDDIREEIKDKKFLRESIRKSDKFFISDWEELQRNIAYYDFPLIDADIQDRIEKLSLKYELLREALNNKSMPALVLLTDRQKKADERMKEHDSYQRLMKENKGVEINDVLAALRTIMEALDNALGNIMEDFKKQYGGFIENCLDYYSEKNESFELKDDLSVVIRVRRDEGTFETTPTRYLNSFRFKLYAISLKLAIAFWYMEKNKIILPIAIDDVFNANDFDNSLHLQYFVHTIYKTYYEKVCKDIPLQLIMLTHDEIILNSFRKGFFVSEISRWGESKEAEEENSKRYRLYKDNCIVARIYRPEEAKRINHQGGNPYNLYLKLN